MFDNLLPQIEIGPLVWWGGGGAALGVLLLTLAVMQLNKLRLYRCPDGEPVPQYWASVRAGGLGKLIGRAWLFVTFAGVGMVAGGCTAVIVGVAL